MKSKIFIFSILILAGLVNSAEAKRFILFAGSQNSSEVNGICVYKFNDQTGRLTDLLKFTPSENPSFLTVSPNKKYLYVTNDVDNLDSLRSGSVSAFRIEPDNHLMLLNKVLTHGSNPCHVAVSPDGKWLVVSNYSAGTLSFFKTQANGSLSEMVQRIAHEGSGPDVERQLEPHVQAARFDTAGKLLYTVDLGTDEVNIYTVPAADRLFVPHATPFVKLVPGSGPCALEFSPDGRFIYTVNELNSTVSVLMKYGAEWKIVQNVRTIPKDYKGENKCAEIKISRDGQFVYLTNRGHNSIAVFKRDMANGKLELIDNMSSEGEWPTGLVLDPSGRYLLAANNRSNTITVFKIDPPSGKLRYTGFKIPAQSPSCLQFQK